MPRPILPFAQPLILCDECRPASAGKIDYLGAFHTIHPESYPYLVERLRVVAHLTGGLGTVNSHVEIRNARTEDLVYAIPRREFHIPS